MIDLEIQAEIKEFSFSKSFKDNLSVVVPTFCSDKGSRTGLHCYYVFDFKTCQGLTIKLRHQDIILPGFGKLKDANYKKYKVFPDLQMLFQKYHYDFNFFEQIMLMTVPHTVTPLKEACFIINLWSYYGYLFVDSKKQKVIYKILEPNLDNHLLGSKQLYEPETESLYYMTYSAEDSLKKVLDPFHEVFSRILKYDCKERTSQELWSGRFSDYMHDFILSKDKKRMVICDMGRFVDANHKLIPSRLLVLDLKEKKEWLIRDLSNAAHVLFDPDDENCLYFSNHNFRFVHTPFFELLQKGSYTIEFFGPASIHKYRLEENGPRKISVYENPELFRMTNFHIFRHKGTKIIAAMGAPNYIFIIDPEEMRLIKKLELKNRSLSESYIGTFVPSFDGERLYIQTNNSFQILNISTGESEVVRSFKENHSCSNHMEILGS